jgi:hypothetical protein
MESAASYPESTDPAMPSARARKGWVARIMRDVRSNEGKRKKVKGKKAERRDRWTSPFYLLPFNFFLLSPDAHTRR